MIGRNYKRAPRRIAVLMFSLGLALAFAPRADADVTLPTVLADHMVVQRGLPTHVWGMADPHEAIAVTFRGENRSTTADDLGRWSIYLSPGEGGGPFPMLVKGNNSITLNDVLVGDVWVASGQSNMEFPMTALANPQPEIAAAQFPQIRIFRVEHHPADYPQSTVEAKTWTACTPESVADSSAVAYYFAREVQSRTHVPIGLIESFWGGTPAESWTSLRSLSADAALMSVFAARAETVGRESTTRLQLKQEAERAIAKAKAEGKPEPDLPWHPDFDAWAPAALFNGMIAPVTPFAIRGVIWYQGEANTGPQRAPLYARVFQTMIRDWRNAWGEGDFPFLFVQIANWSTAAEDLWPDVRNAQRQALALKNTGMAVTIDIGDPVDIHPKNKHDVGVRLALAARALAYGEKLEYSGPLYRQVTAEEHALRVWFDHADGLNAKGTDLTGFEVAGADGKYSPAEAKIDGTSIVVSSATVPTPVSVRYGWAANPTCNLYNRAGLPASPFQAPE
ncbi:MAG TPA: sialate O-acetylesterase [Candidatus Sulfotelmatobacter sp.]|nr:sialate O-acetylesterase [Candidatus Sulfotelmatobacter sp.]